MPKSHFSYASGTGYTTAAELSNYDSPPAPTGNVWYVHTSSLNPGASDAAGYGHSPDKPFSTLAYALTKCIATNDDWVFVLPGHTESITAAGTITMSTAGVRVVGLGTGRARPKFTSTNSTGASWDVTAANCHVENVVFKCSIDNQTAMINVQAADFSLKDCEVEFADSSYQAALAVLTTAAADRMRIENCHFHGTTDAGTATAIRIVGGTDAQILNNKIIGAFTTTLGGIDQNTTTAVNPIVAGNFIANQTASATKAMVWSSSSNVFFTNNRFFILSGTAPVTAAAGLNGGSNYYSAAAGVTAATLL